MGRQRGGIDRKGLVRVVQLKIALQASGIDRFSGGFVAAILIKLDIPPPFLDGVQPAAPDPVVQLGQHRCGLRDMHRRPSERRFGKEPLQVPRAGLHAAPAHRPALGGDAIGGAFLAVGFPDLIAVEHELRPCGNRTRRAFARAFVAGFAKALQAEIDRLVMHHRHIGGHHPRFQPRAQERVQDHLADAADLPQPAQEQQRRLQDLAIEHGMRLGRVAQIADLLGNDAAQQRKPQIGAHALRDADPVIARGALHGLVALIDDHRDGMRLARLDGRAGGVMGIPGPIGDSG